MLLINIKDGLILKIVFHEFFYITHVFALTYFLFYYLKIIFILLSSTILLSVSITLQEQQL
jgi:hypothetical protein